MVAGASSIMANVVDTKLYDILGVSPSASENELKKVRWPSSERPCTREKHGNASEKEPLDVKMWPTR